MKSEKGITLVSLILYIILLCVVVAILSALSNLFFSNTNYLIDNAKNIAEYNKFAMYFIEDVKNNKDALSISNHQITFADGTMYTYVEGPDYSIYRNKVKICKSIAYCSFLEKEEQVNNVTKKIIQVNMIINSKKMFETNNEFVLKYW